jgi:hypothetical protein
MIRKPFKMNAFKMIAAACCLSTLVGLNTPAHAVQASPANTYISDCAWLGTGPMPALIINAKGQNMAGNVSGYFAVASATFSAEGYFVSEADYVDQAGQHIEVRASVNFKLANTITSAAVASATATLKTLKKTDGSTWQGVEITDAAGTVLYSTGYDASNELVLLPIMRGSLFMNH